MVGGFGLGLFHFVLEVLVVEHLAEIAFVLVGDGLVDHGDLAEFEVDDQVLVCINELLKTMRSTLPWMKASRASYTTSLPR